MKNYCGCRWGKREAVSVEIDASMTKRQSRWEQARSQRKISVGNIEVAWSRVVSAKLGRIDAWGMGSSVVSSVDWGMWETPKVLRITKYLGHVPWNWVASADSNINAVCWDFENKLWRKILDQRVKCGFWSALKSHFTRVYIRRSAHPHFTHGCSEVLLPASPPFLYCPLRQNIVLVWHANVCVHSDSDAARLTSSLSSPIPSPYFPFFFPSFP